MARPSLSDRFRGISSCAALAALLPDPFRDRRFRRANPVTEPSKLDRNGRPSRAPCSKPRSRSRRSRGAARARAWPTGSPSNIAPRLGRGGHPDHPAQGRSGRGRLFLVRPLAGGQALRQEADPDHRHMDVVEAKRGGLEVRPLRVREKDGYFYGRGTSDDKQGVIGTTAALFKLAPKGSSPTATSSSLTPAMRRPRANGARMGATEGAALEPDAELRSTPTPAAARSRRDGTPARLRHPDRREDLPDYFLTATNRGGHRAGRARQRDLRPRPSAEPAEAYRFEPALTETSRAYFTARPSRRAGRWAMPCALARQPQ